MASIYRKYRPKTFKEMVGQNHIKMTLMSEIASGNFTHAYLFCGPRGLGKTTVARLLAKAVNCEARKEGETEPCNKCQSCLEINEGRAMDLMEIDAASHTGVDNVRENIIDNVRFSPHRSKFKVFIIDEVHMLSISAFNALLKTLEEPPAHAIFILCTTETHKVPETIISRCQRFDFKKVAPAEAIKRLKMIADSEKVKIEEEVFEVIAIRSEGCMRDAENFLGQVLSLGEKKITFEQATLVLPSADISLVMAFLKIIFSQQTGEALDFINKMVDDGVDLEVFNKELVIFLRKMILVKEGAVKSDWIGMLGKVGSDMTNIVERATVAQLVENLKIFLSVGRDLKDSEIQQLPLELAVVTICDKGRETGRIGGIDGGTMLKMPTIIRREKEQEAKKEPGQEKSEEEPLVVFKKSDNQGVFQEIEKKWTQIIKAGHQKSRDLMFINESMVWPLLIENDTLEIGFKYDLHKSRFEMNSNKDIFVEAIKEIVGQELKVRGRALKPSELAELDMRREAREQSEESLSGVKVAENDILGQVLESFGGEVVE
ncbi:DNA polymerase III subunit gamma/tau [Candidatus Kuenenbacteria bacterium]|nr:DNA polymerase III subunit gamma/tau [Candidatus Kuenenbacteria bacterium]